MLLEFANSPPKHTFQPICEADKDQHASCDAHHDSHGTDSGVWQAGWSQLLDTAKWCCHVF